MRWIKGFDVLEKICMFILIVSLSGMSIFISMQVFFRYVLNSPLAWTEEAARHLMIWTAFMGGAIGYRKKAHLGIDILTHFLKKNMLNTIQIVMNALIIVLSGLILYYGYIIVTKTMPQLSSALNIPMGFIYASIPAGFLFIGLFAIENIIVGFRTSSKSESRE